VAYYIGITGAAGLLTIAVVVGVMARQIRQAALPRNGLFGIRTAQTKASDEAWRAGHGAALPLLRVAVVVAVIAAAVLLGLSVWLAHAAPGSAESVEATAVQVLFGVVVVVVLAAAVKANRAARDVNSR
jgi:divalent metal cation (Fe/Co/Zn/Cd) transporter